MKINVKNKQAGMGMVDALAALLIIAMMMPMLGDMMDRGFQYVDEKNVSSHLAAVLDAASGYAKEHYPDLISSSTASSATTVTMDQLRAGNYLSAGFQNRNAWGQRYGIYVLEPNAEDLQVIVLTYDGRTSTAKNKRFGTASAPSAAAMVGGSGGYIPTGDLPGQSPTELRGSQGGWVVNLAGTNIPIPSPGHIGGRAFLREGELRQDFLYRVEVPGHPELNEMSTELDMTDHAIENVKEIQFEKHTIGDIDASGFCGDPDKEGRVFLDPDVGLYVCRNGEPQVIADSGNSQIFKDATYAVNGQLIPKPICPPGVTSTPQIFVAPAVISEGPISKSFVAVQSWATDEGDNWRVHLRIKDVNDDWIFPPDGYGQVMVITTCN